MVVPTLCYWAKLIDGVLANASELPENLMYSRAGCDSTSSSTQKKSEVVALSEVAKQLFSTSDPRQPTGQSNIENRSRCYSQFKHSKIGWSSDRRGVCCCHNECPKNL